MAVTGLARPDFRTISQFLLRGLGKVAHEWALICTAHNLTRLCQADLAIQARAALPCTR